MQPQKTIVIFKKDVLTNVFAPVFNTIPNTVETVEIIGLESPRNFYFFTIN